MRSLWVLLTRTCLLAKRGHVLVTCPLVLPLACLLAPVRAQAAPWPDLDELWKKGRGAGLVIALLDTGVDAAHPAIKDRLLPGWSFVDGSPDTADRHGHGTALAGALVGNGAAGVQGVAPEATLLPVKVCMDLGVADPRAAAEGLDWARAQGARVACLALGAICDSPELAEAVRRAREQGVLVVAPAGQGGTAMVADFPARLPECLGVTAHAPDGRLAPGANLDQDTHLAGPQAVTGAGLDGGHVVLGGTSAAAAAVAGLAAALWSADLQQTAGDLEDLLWTTGEPLAEEGLAHLFPTRRVRPAAAVAALGRWTAAAWAPSVPEAGGPEAALLYCRLEGLEQDSRRLELRVEVLNRTAATLPGLVLEVRMRGARALPLGLSLAPGERRRAVLVLDLDPAEGSRDKRRLELELRRGERSLDLFELPFRFHPRKTVLQPCYADLRAVDDVVLDAPWWVAPGREFVPVLVYCPEIYWQVDPLPGEVPTQVDDKAVIRLREFAVAQIPTPHLQLRPPGRWPQDQVLYWDNYGSPPAKGDQYSIEKPDGALLSTQEAQRDGLLASDPITEAGWYRILLLPRAELEARARQDRLFGDPNVAWLLAQAGTTRQLLRGHPDYAGWATIRHWEHFEKVLKVRLGQEVLPTVAPGDRYLDAHYHTQSEYTTRHDTFAPKKAFGGPLRMVLRCAEAMGFIDNVRDETAYKDKVITTDHNGFYVDWDIPAVGTYKAYVDTPKQEMQAVREVFGERTTGQEVTLSHWPLRDTAEAYAGFSLGRHALVYGHPRPFDGPWHGGKEYQTPAHAVGATAPLADVRILLKETLGLETERDRILLDRAVAAERNPLELRKVLDSLVANGGAMVAAHPVTDSFTWSDEMMETALFGRKSLAYGVSGGNPLAFTRDGEFVFKGVQFWNGVGQYRTRKPEPAHLQKCNPFGDPQAVDPDLKVATLRMGPAPDWADDLKEGWRRWLQWLGLGLDHSVDQLGSGRLRILRKVYAVAGSDAHGDFNYTTDISFSHGDRAWFLNQISDSAFGKVRTCVQGGGLDDMLEGRAVMTNGPVLTATLDAQYRFDDQGLVWHNGWTPQDARDADGRMGGEGVLDGGATALVPPHGDPPVLSYAWTNTSEFGGPLGRLEAWAVHRGARRDGTRYTRASRVLTRAGVGRVPVGERAPADLPLADGPCAVILRGSTLADEPAFFAPGAGVVVANPVWVVPVQPRVTVRQVKDAGDAYLIPPGGLEVVWDFGISMQPRTDMTAAIKQLDHQGDSTGGAQRLRVVEWRSTGGVRNNQVKLLNPEALVLLKGDGWWSPAEPATAACHYLADPRDALGNPLHAIAGLFGVAKGDKDGVPPPQEPPPEEGIREIPPPPPAPPPPPPPPPPGAGKKKQGVLGWLLGWLKKQGKNGGDRGQDGQAVHDPETNYRGTGMSYEEYLDAVSGMQEDLEDDREDRDWDDRDEPDGDAVGDE